MITVLFDTLTTDALFPRNCFWKIGLLSCVSLNALFLSFSVPVYPPNLDHRMLLLRVEIELIPTILSKFLSPIPNALTSTLILAFGVYTRLVVLLVLVTPTVPRPTLVLISPYLTIFKLSESRTLHSNISYSLFVVS